MRIPADRAQEDPQEGRLRFVRLLADLSSTFVNLAADPVDAEIERARERLVDFLGAERSGFGQVSEDDGTIVVSHSFPAAADLARRGRPPRRLSPARPVS